MLEGQDEQLRTFLLETSLLERLSGPLCDAVTGREGSQALLEEAERAGLFLIPLDEVRGWWRYHHLFADLLRVRLLLACPQGHVRIFADEGPPMAALLGRLIAAQRAGQAAAEVPLGYLARLQRAFDTGRPAPDPSPSGIVDPLTSREFEVLEMLAAGRSNQAIAGELVVTLDTVKKHVGHVLGKLGAANRTEAVARARELSLIP